MNYKEAKKKALIEFHKTYIRELVKETKNNISKAARLAGLDRSNFRRLMKSTGLKVCVRCGEPIEFKDTRYEMQISLSDHGAGPRCKDNYACEKRYGASFEKCPKCDSPKPHLHPAVQHGGEVGVCDHPFHLRTQGE